MNFNIKSKLLIGIWLFILSLGVVARCNPLLIFRTSGIEYILISTTAVIAILFNANRIITKDVLICDVFIIMSLLVFITSNELSKYIFYVMIFVLAYFVIQRNYEMVTFIEYPLVIFAIFTSVITWISYFSPQFYINNILPLFPEGVALKYSFLNRNMYHGFTNHYSRNSYYISVGILLLFSSWISQKKKSKLILFLIIFLFGTQFLVAKRGPTLFLVLTLFVVILKKEPNIIKKMGNSFKFIVIVIVLFAIAYIFVPGVDNLITRIITPNDSDDISSSRFYLWAVAWNMFKKNIIFGNGWGSYLKAMEGSTFQGAHNDYLQLLAETGLIGFTLWIFANVDALYRSAKIFNKYRSPLLVDSKEQKWIIFSFAFQIYFMLYALTGMPHFTYEQYGLYLLLTGFAIGLYKKQITKYNGEI